VIPGASCRRNYGSRRRRASFAANRAASEGFEDLPRVRRQRQFTSPDEPFPVSGNRTGQPLAIATVGGTANCRVRRWRPCLGETRPGGSALSRMRTPLAAWAPPVTFLRRDAGTDGQRSRRRAGAGNDEAGCCASIHRWNRPHVPARAVRACPVRSGGTP